jgi:exopolysaccharide biosynthesis polyprenyl glycosylphosphotransferase
LLLYRERLYHTQRLATLVSQWTRLAKVHLYGALGLAVLAFVAKLAWLSRSLLLISVAISFVALGVERSIAFALLHAVRRRGRNTRNALLVGITERALEIAAAAEAHPEWGLEIIGFIESTDGNGAGGNEPGNRVDNHIGSSGTANRNASTALRKNSSVLGTVGDLPRLLEQHVVDEVIFCVPASELERVSEAIAETELRGINSRLVADFVDLKIARTEAGYLNGVPILTFASGPQRAFDLMVKRLIDVVLASLSLVFASPFAALIAVAIWLDSEGPVFFSQERVGQNGRRFVLYKFRTMEAETSGVPAELREHNEMNGPVFKLRQDPRVTRVGRFLRRWSLDEMPQLLNVLRDQMSLVGPRPPLPDEVAQYETWQRRRLSMKPGMTGLWQISGRNEIDFEEWIRLDLRYIDNWSVKEDLWILARTLPAVIIGRGAH